MKKNKKDIVIFILMIIFIFVMNIKSKMSLELTLVLMSTFLLITTIISYILIGIKKNVITILNKKIINNLLISFLVYYIIIYLLGLLTGYGKNPFQLKGILIIIFYFINIILLEVTRFIFVTKDSKPRINLIIITIIITAINLLIFKDFISLNLLTILTITINNLFLAYLSFNFGYKVSLVYRFLLEGLIVIIPIFPNLSKNSILLFTIILIFVIYHNLKKVYKNYEHNSGKSNFVSNKYRLIYIPFLILFIFTLIVISKDFKIYLMGIASNSMSPKLNRGDAILVKKVITTKDISLGDIVVFEHNNKKIIHRIVKVIENDNKEFYQTKGDNNKLADELYLSIDEIEGKFYLKIPFLAYPSIKTREIINKRKEG